MSSNNKAPADLTKKKSGFFSRSKFNVSPTQPTQPIQPSTEPKEKGLNTISPSATAAVVDSYKSGSTLSGSISPKTPLATDPPIKSPPSSGGGFFGLKKVSSPVPFTPQPNIVQNVSAPSRAMQNISPPPPIVSAPPAPADIVKPPQPENAATSLSKSNSTASTSKKVPPVAPVRQASFNSVASPPLPLEIPASNFDSLQSKHATIYSSISSAKMPDNFPSASFKSPGSPSKPITTSFPSNISNVSTTGITANRKKRELYGVRVLLPRDITTIILCDEYTTIGDLTTKALDKLRLILGLQFDPYHVLLTLPQNDKEGLENDLFVSEIHNFKENPNKQPTFKIVYNSDLSTNTHQFENEDETGTPPEEPDLQQNALSAPDQFPINNLAKRFGSMDYVPDSSKDPETTSSIMTNDRYPNTDNIRSRTTSDAMTGTTAIESVNVLPEELERVVDRKGLVSIADIIGVSSTDENAEGAGNANLNKAVKGKLQNNKQRKFRPSSMYAVKYVKAQVHVVEFQFIDIKQKLQMEVLGDSTISQIKEILWEHPKLPSNLEQMEYYHFRYISPEGNSVELFDEQQLFHTISILKYWNQKGSMYTFQVESKQKHVNKQMQALSKKIGFVIGYGLYRFDYLRDAEVDIFRRKMVAVRQNAIRTRDLNVYNFRPEFENRAASQKVLEKLGPSGKIQYKLNIPISQLTKTLQCQYDETPEKLIASFLPKNTRFYLPEGSKVEDYCLKVSGRAEYLVGNYKMIDFTYIRQCILRDDKIVLNLIPVKDVPQSTNQAAIEEFDVIEDPTANMGSHAQLTIQGRTEAQIRTISLWDIARSYRVQITACENLNVGAIEAIYVEVGLFHGGKPLCPSLKTHQVLAGRSPRFGAWLNFDLACYNLPRTARMCITVWGRWSARKKISQDKENDVYPLGWVNFLLMDYKGYLKTGLVKLALWPGEKANPIGTCVSLQNFDEASIYLRLDSFAHPVIFPTETYSDEYKSKALVVEHIPDIIRPVIENVLASDPLYRIDDDAAKTLWKYRYHVMHRPEALPKVLLSARWEVLDDVIEVKKLLKAWAPMPPESAIELLDANFADINVRAYATTRLELLSDDRVLDYLLQLVQALKYEPYLDCALGSFLLKRALRNRTVGHYFFWYLKSEMEDPTVSLRFALLLEAYLRGCGVFMDDFARQTDVLTKLSDVATAIKRVKTSAERKEVLTYEISRFRVSNSFQIALDPKMEASGLIVEKCKYMDSKKLPLWLVFANADDTGNDTYVLFKVGDDLRQDMLTLQMIRIMDKLWQQESLDLRMMPYGCLATGNGVGMIEVVLNAETVSSIQIAYGGSSAAFRDQPLEEWLRKQNPDDADYAKAVETFTLSCAGYCVATYVLGIGDRHNDNIMITKDGHLFHIDFGHFLGNIKKKFGFKRERAPFVLTPDFVYVMGKREGKEGEQFKRFIDYCVQAYLILRRKANMFINFFAMMLSTGIPELKSAEDIHYLRDALCLGKSEEQAALEFRGLIFESLRLGWSTQLNWWLHNLVHSK